jgi:hypothetical protein
VNQSFFRPVLLIVLGIAFVSGTCGAGPRIKRIQDLSDSADTPYENILVVALFDQFDSRRRLEKAIVNGLTELGTKAVASTSMMDTRTPVTRETFLAMLDELDSDALLVTHLVDIEAETDLKDSASPEASLKVRPTYYFNVWDIRITEYKEPQTIEIKGSVVLATEMYSVRLAEPVWAIESNSKFVQTGGPEANYLFYIDEGDAIVKHLKRDRLVEK